MDGLAKRIVHQVSARATGFQQNPGQLLEILSNGLDVHQ